MSLIKGKGKDPKGFGKSEVEKAKESALRKAEMAEELRRLIETKESREVEERIEGLGKRLSSIAPGYASTYKWTSETLPMTYTSGGFLTTTGTSSGPVPLPEIRSPEDDVVSRARREFGKWIESNGDRIEYKTPGVTQKKRPEDTWTLKDAKQGDVIKDSKGFQYMRGFDGWVTLAGVVVSDDVLAEPLTCLLRTTS